jgi:hypothetical protein
MNKFVGNDSGLICPTCGACPEQERVIYFIQKVGAYYHGVFWIGTDEEEGHKEARRLAQADRDDHHGWVLYKYITVPNNTHAPYRCYPPNGNEEVASYRHGHLL